MVPRGDVDRRGDALQCGLLRHERRVHERGVRRRVHVRPGRVLRGREQQQRRRSVHARQLLPRRQRAAHAMWRWRLLVPRGLGDADIFDLRRWVLWNVRR